MSMINNGNLVNDHDSSINVNNFLNTTVMVEESD